MSYRPGLPNVLHDVNLSINAGEKIGIVGRTGMLGTLYLRDCIDLHTDRRWKIFAYSMLAPDCGVLWTDQDRRVRLLSGCLSERLLISNTP